jgi:glycosyltransferase involved in cell wall biosynthesis
MKFKLAIIIPFFNAKKYIPDNFKICQELTKKFSIQIIYIDNNSSDGSFNILKRKIGKNENISLKKTKAKSKHSPGTARNLGIKFAEANNLLFLDIDDQLVVKNFTKLFFYMSKKNYSFLHLNRNNITYKKNEKRTFTPYSNYDKNSLKKFFTESNSMECIGIIYNKKFLLKNKLFFLSGIYEDIFFTFKTHFFNNRKVNFFPNTIYLKIINKSSITNSRVTKLHLDGKFNAWKSIDLFLRQKLSVLKYKRLFKYLQYRWRGELANEHNKILNSNYNLREKRLLIRYVVLKYKKFIMFNYNVITAKDKIVHKLLGQTF